MRVFHVVNMYFVPNIVQEMSTVSFLKVQTFEVREI